MANQATINPLVLGGTIPEVCAATRSPRTIRANSRVSEKNERVTLATTEEDLALRRFAVSVAEARSPEVVREYRVLHVEAQANRSRAEADYLDAMAAYIGEGISTETSAEEDEAIAKACARAGYEPVKSDVPKEGS